jgi:rhomboid protease GluP
MNQEQDQEVPLIPVVRQPRGAAYFWGTWTGRLQVVNAIVFLLMVFVDSSAIFVPGQDLVRSFGSKSLVEIANGEWWRYVTPVFVHIGAIHFFFNAMGLYYIGYQIEHILGWRWYLAVYMLAGIIGNLTSCLASVQISAGASGAIFGLLGAGFRLEGLVSDAFDNYGGRQRPRRRIYTSMALTNIALGLFIPVIDNAAHIGGFVGGLIVTEIMLRVRPNRLRRPGKFGAALLALGVLIFAVIAVARTNDKDKVSSRYYREAVKAESARDAYYLLSESLRVRPLEVRSLLYRGRLLLQNGEGAAGLRDISVAMKTGKVTREDIESLASDLRLTGHSAEAELVLRLSVNGEGLDL